MDIHIAVRRKLAGVAGTLDSWEQVEPLEYDVALHCLERYLGWMVEGLDPPWSNMAPAFCNVSFDYNFKIKFCCILFRRCGPKYERGEALKFEDMPERDCGNSSWVGYPSEACA